MTDRTKPREWTDVEELLIEESKIHLDRDKNPLVLKCLFCPRLFRFEDQVTDHTWKKHRRQIVAEIVYLRRDLREAKDAIATYRKLASENNAR